ncbi:Holliday junction resolvase RuvX [Arthrobacter sp. H5]|uniref:Holliday junction resolvase RuvX n=1 Tax=Arthrobacter sp. H5 TaxID=1267973 RepID=UPI0004BAA228|nr:Holliday junction resolvase RuvX [Arthrobacter sp. H5]
MDVGMVRVGVAASDADGLMAMPVHTVRRDPKKNSDLRLLVRDIRDRAAVEVFVGLPRNLSGSESASSRMARDYAFLLADALAKAGMDVPVRLVDERLSTVSAHRSLRQAGLNTREHRKVVDQVAAVEILQHAIDMQRSRGRDVGEPVVVRRQERSQGVPPTAMEEPDISQIQRAGEDGAP